MIRSGPLSLVLVAIVAFVVGLSSNRIYTEMKVANGAVLEAGGTAAGGGGGRQVVLKGEREQLRDKRMEEIVRKHG